MLRCFSIIFFSLMITGVCFAQTDSSWTPPKFDSYQIYLKKPAKEIKQLLYEKNCEPIKGNISDGKKTIIMHDYEPGNKVHVQVIYEDGTDDEFVRSPCFIDPVIL